MKALMINNLLYPNAGSEMHTFLEMGRAARVVFISLLRFSNSR